MLRTENLAIGAVTVETDENAVRRITMGGPVFSDCSPLLAECFRQLRAYLAGALTAFDLPFKLDGTAFQIAVWEALRKIPYGETRCYSEIAAEIGKPQSARAVGAACKQNSLPLLIPCHRVVGKSGLTGFSFGSGTELKKELIQLEKSNVERRLPAPENDSVQ